MTKKHKGQATVYAIIRLDEGWREASDPSLYITVKEIIDSLETAKAETTPLNQLNAGKGCEYFWQCTRMYPPGQSAGPESAEE